MSKTGPSSVRWTVSSVKEMCHRIAAEGEEGLISIFHLRTATVGAA